MPTQTEAQRIVCHDNSDCGLQRNGSMYCDGNTLKYQVSQPSCRSPGTPQSACVFRERVQPYLDCTPDICLLGSCYPQSCDNQVLDYNETDIDCGGICPPCDSSGNRTCSQPGDCGQEHYLGGLWCSEGNIMGDKVSYGCGLSGRCSAKAELTTFRECKGEYACFTGESACRTHEATCGNCRKDGNEERTDCGGDCWPCAPSPSNTASDGEHLVLYFPDTDNVFTYKGYDIRYMGPLYSGHVGEYQNCTYGAIVRIRQPNLTSEDVQVTRYRNNGIGGIVVGFYWADDWSAKLWVTG